MDFTVVIDNSNYLTVFQHHEFIDQKVISANLILLMQTAIENELR